MTTNRGDMPAGTSVIVICHSYSYWCGNHPSPPVGSLGVVTESADEFDELLVEFADYPCPTVDPGWFLHRSHLIPVSGQSDAVKTLELERTK